MIIAKATILVVISLRWLFLWLSPIAGKYGPVKTPCLELKMSLCHQNKSSLILFFWPIVFQKIENWKGFINSWLILFLEKDITPHKKWSVISLENVLDPNLFANLFSFTKKSFKIKLALLYSIICKWIHGINWTCILSIWQLGGKSTRFSWHWKPGLFF